MVAENLLFLYLRTALNKIPPVHHIHAHFWATAGNTLFAGNTTSRHIHCCYWLFLADGWNHVKLICGE